MAAWGCAPVSKGPSMSQGTFERRTLNATIRNHGRMRADPEYTFIAASVLGGFGSPHPPLLPSGMATWSYHNIRRLDRASRMPIKR